MLHCSDVHLRVLCCNGVSCRVVLRCAVQRRLLCCVVPLCVVMGCEVLWYVGWCCGVQGRDVLRCGVVCIVVSRCGCVVLCCIVVRCVPRSAPVVFGCVATRGSARRDVLRRESGVLCCGVLCSGALCRGVVWCGRGV